MTFWQRWCVLIVVCLGGCTANTAGSEADARNHFDSEFKKWMAGQVNTVSTFSSRTRGLSPPISYEIRSVVEDRPYWMACADISKPPKDLESWPAYKANVAIEWKSEAGTPLTKITTYRLTWNASEKRWYVDERF